MERIWGPVNGFWLAAYAAPAVEGDRYCSYAKVCWRRPSSYWDADCAFKIFGGEHHRSLESALGSVVLDARNEITCLPRNARALVERHRRDHAPIPRIVLASFFRHRWA